MIHKKYEPKVIAQQLLKLSEYLHIPIHTLMKRCGLSRGKMIDDYLSGVGSPTLSTINKILSRYPVKADWLLYGEGDMWTIDYFEQRFNECKLPSTTPSDKVKFLLDTFEVSMHQLSVMSGISLTSIRKMSNGYTKEISPTLINKLVKAFPFIPVQWYA